MEAARRPLLLRLVEDYWGVLLLLIAWADLSYEEVARAVAIPVGTVRSRLNRARRKTREALGGCDPRLLSEELCT